MEIKRPRGLASRPPELCSTPPSTGRSSPSRFTIQKEVAERLSADPGGRTYGLLTVLLGLYFRVDQLFV
jgi:16S rRNA A1518/A1519 N6-dimethyltransferase RsmA/KsgA/DIM1 with predicted DNA glycosylase/AP lyase activity